MALVGTREIFKPVKEEQEDEWFSLFHEDPVAALQNDVGSVQVHEIYMNDDLVWSEKENQDKAQR